MPTWKDFSSFIRFAIYSFLTFGSLVGGWIALDLPKVASQTYVDNKFQPIQSQLIATRLQLNRMTKQGLEAEQYRLTNELKTNNSFDLQRRLNAVNDELIDVVRERDLLLNSKN